MNTLLEKVAPGVQGVVEFHYRSKSEETMPDRVADPLELLGDISRLQLDDDQAAKLRKILEKDIDERGMASVWRERTFRKNLILSQGRIV
ncbi:MAG: hypothetical protein D6E12_10185 [Desulfovibrio sp.]|nr:MAG: hypothetical protein D6E12_10185 [Desulfovibrio sp.]